jgi:hypothetical protein
MEEQERREKNESPVRDWLTTEEKHKNSAIYMNARRNRTERNRERTIDEQLTDRYPSQYDYPVAKEMPV